MDRNDIPNIKKVALCAIALIVLALCAYFYWDTRSNIAQSVEYALEEAIEKDFQEREFAELRVSGGKLGRKLKGVTIVTEEGEEDFEFKDSIDEAVGHRLAAQYMLAKIHPLHPDTLNSLLQETLRKYDFKIPTGVLYTHNRQVQYSDNDSATLRRPFLHWTRNRTLDVKRTVSVQAWASITPWHICLNMHAGAFWSLLLFGVVASWAVLTWNTDDKDPHKVKFGKMVFDKENRKLAIGGKECALRHQEYCLLLMLVEKPGHTMGREEIVKAFWKDEAGVENRVHNLVSRLRNALKDFPDYQIDLKGEDNYTLIYTGEQIVS